MKNFAIDRVMGLDQADGDAQLYERLLNSFVNDNKTTHQEMALSEGLSPEGLLDAFESSFEEVIAELAPLF